MKKKPIVRNTEKEDLQTLKAFLLKQIAKTNKRLKALENHPSIK